MTDQPLLAVHDLVAGFRTDAGFVAAVDGVSFDLAAGAALGVVGESGCGKSALAYSIARLLPAAGRIQSGAVRFAGVDLATADERVLGTVRGRRLAMVFQDPMSSLNPYRRVGGLIAEPLRRHLGLGRTAAWRRAVELLTQVGIPDPEQRARRHPHELSGGQRQRVLIALALSCDPHLLIADEPTTALDVTVQRQVLDLIAAERGRRGLALILISHNLGVVAGMCDRVAVMYAGRMVESAPTAALFRDPRHPYTRALFAAVPRLGGARGQALAAIPGQPPTLTADRRGCAFAPRCPHAIDRCRTEAPAERVVADGHRLRCHVDLPTGTPP